MAYTPTTSKTHEFLRKALAGHQGRTLKTSQILKMVRDCAPEIGKRIQWLNPSDHCLNHRPKGGCTCGGTEEAVLVKIQTGLYLVRDQQSRPKEENLGGSIAG